jgi:Na+/H+-dicarboxylate symporter
MSLSGQILIGLVAGVAVGLFFGETVAPLQIVADGFIKLLQMTVLRNLSDP